MKGPHLYPMAHAHPQYVLTPRVYPQVSGLPTTLRCPHALGMVPRPGTHMRAQATSQVTSGAPMTTEVPPNHAPSNDGHCGCPAHAKACPHEKKGTTSHTPSMLSLTLDDMLGHHQYIPNPNRQAQSHQGLAWALQMHPLPFRNPAVQAQSQPRICPDMPHPQVHTWSHWTLHVRHMGQCTPTPPTRGHRTRPHCTMMPTPPTDAPIPPPQETNGACDPCTLEPLRP